MASELKRRLGQELLQWTVEEVVEWLSSLELSKDYSGLFKDHNIDGTSLSKMTTSYIDNTLNISNSSDRLILVQSLTNLRMTQLAHHLPRLSSTSSDDPPLFSPPPPPPSLPSSVGVQKNTQTKRRHKSKSVDEMDGPSSRDSTLSPPPLPPSRTSAPPKSLTPTPHFSSPHMLDILKDENTALKKELEYYYQRVCKLQKLEQELEHLSEAHKLLETSTARKEKLELVMRQKLETELRHYKEADVQREVNLHSIRRNASFKAVKPEVTVKRELARRDSVIVKLIQQNHDVTAVREKLEKDLNTMRSALSATERKTDNNNRGTEREQKEEGEEKTNESQTAASNYSNSINKLQSILSSMLSSSQKQSKLEHQLRKQLEVRINELEKGRERGERGEREDLRVATLEADKAKLEHKCLELIAERQLIQDLATIPRDTYISQLERQLTEKENELIKTKEQKTYYMKTLETTQDTLLNSSTRIHSLEATLKERDSLIDALKSLLEPDDSSLSLEGQSSRKTSLGTANTSSTVLGPPLRKISSPVLLSTDSDHYNNTVVLPTYDQHIQKCHTHITLAPPSNHLHPKVRSFPNTPEVQRRGGGGDCVNYRGLPSPALSAPNSHHGSPLPVHKPRPFYKSLTPPPHQLPPYTVATQRLKTYKSHTDAKSLDSDDSIDSFLCSPLSPSTNSWHRHSNSFPTRRGAPLDKGNENRSQDSGVLVEGGGPYYCPSHF